MFVLGISCFFHDAAAALLEDGVLVAAAEEERFSRIKHDTAFPEKAIEFCLRQRGINAEDIEYVAFFEKPLVKVERLFASIFATVPRSSSVFREATIAWFEEKLWVKSLLQEKFGLGADRLLFIEHHVSHAASSFLCSPFDEAAILTVDGVGEWTTAGMGVGRTVRNNDGETTKLITTHEMRFPHSLGLLYSAFTEYLGFQVNEGEYKVMGMASYGEPRYVEKVHQLLDLKSDGSFKLDLSYFQFHHSTRATISSKFETLFGPRRRAESRFVTHSAPLPKDEEAATEEELKQNQYYADVAASIQRATEEILLAMANRLHRDTGLKNLCMAGGVALNSRANGRILAESPFENLYIQPAAGDNGGALGAALYATHVLLGLPRKWVMQTAAWGEAHDADAVATFLRANDIPHEHFDDEDTLCASVAAHLASGRVAGWHQGRFEWGPRALGQRSILADPRRDEMKEIVNVKIKFREPFRPFAPSVLGKKAETYFDLKDAASRDPARFMLLVAPVKDIAREQLPATTHVDGTARLQTVFEETNGRYAKLIRAFEKESGVPVVLNTSFNLRGEPIVNTPAEAYNTFSQSGLDILVLGEHVVSKSDLK